MDKERFIKIISTGLEEMGLPEESLLTEKLWLYMNFLVEENNKYNLTAIDREEEIIRKHFLDSLVFFTKYDINIETRIMDVGTGAGFPGLVMKIYREDIHLVLLDSLNKRINFLNKLIKKLN